MCSVTDIRMPTNSAQVTLVAPGCFSELSVSEPELNPAKGDSARIAAELNAASVLKTDYSSYEQAVLGSLGQAGVALGDLPVAQHCLLIDAQASSYTDCVCAELVHLQADTSNARLIPHQALDISADDSRRLVESVNGLVEEDGLKLIRKDTGELYFTGMPAMQLDSWPAHSLATGKIANYLPRQSEAGDWRRLLTEVQMLFHDHPVNAERAQRQLLPINAIWFWGGRRLEQYAPTDVDTLVAADAFSHGLASALKIPVRDASAIDWQAIDGKVVIVELGVYDAWLKGDVDALLQAKHTLNTRWIEPAQQAVADGLIQQFVLDGCEGQAIVETQKKRTGFSLLSSSRRLFSQLTGSTSAKSPTAKSSKRS